MASSYTPLGVELMVTGENAGTWGTKTNANLNLVEGITGGYVVATLNAAGTGANTTALTVADGALTGTAQSRVIILGAESPQAITGNKIVTLPLDVENTYYIKNSTSGAYTVQLKYASGSGDTVTWATTDKGWKIISASGNDGTNPDIYEIVAGGLPGGSNTQVQFNSSGSFAGSSNLTFDGTDLTMASAKVSDLTNTRVVTAGASGALSDDANFIWDASTGLNIGTSKEIRLQDDSGGQYIGQKAANSTTSYTLTWPATTGSANQILQTNGSGVLSFVDNSGGTSWQAVKTGNYTASAGEGVFANTTSSAWTLTLPAGSIGDEVSFIDYAGTFDSNALTIAANGSEKINGSTADLTVSVERAANTLVYTDGTQGWLLKNK